MADGTHNRRQISIMIASKILSNPKTVIKSIDKRSNLSRNELFQEYIKPSVPVILKDATRDWTANGKFTFEFFKENYGHVSKNINGITYQLGDVIDLILAEDPNRQAPYPFNFNLKTTFPKLLPDLLPEVLYSQSDRINHPLLPSIFLHGTTPYELFFGGKGSGFPFLHIDALNLHTQITQLYGSKDFILFSPDQTPYLYPNAENQKFSLVDVFNPDYEQHPLFKNAEPIKFTLNQGETLLFPTGWWHTTQIHEPNITFGRSQLNAANWDHFIHDNYLAVKKKVSFLAAPVLGYGRVLGEIMDRQESKIS